MKYLFTLHHYLGVFFFLLFLIWFLSGFVMMYHGFPFLSEEERIKGNSAQDMDATDLLHPSDVFKHDSIGSIHQFRINHRLGRPVYHVVSTSGQTRSKYADNGQPLRVDVAKAVAIAREATKINESPEVTTLQEVDQWIPRLKYRKHLPVFKVQFSDSARSRVYVSSLTGEPISMTTQSQRTWAWLGAIPHWIYLKEIRVHKTLWKQLICWLAGLGLIMTLTGMVTGIYRFKKKPKARFRRFKNPWYNLHYYFGLGFGLFICTWVFSGLMSMSPFHWAPSTSLSPSETQAWQGQDFTLESFTKKNWNGLIRSSSVTGMQEMELYLFDNQLFARISGAGPQGTICLPDPGYQPRPAEYLSKINELAPKDTVVKSELMDSYDSYYYDRQDKKPLPVLKATTSSDTYFYIHPGRATVLYKCAPKNRAERWLYHGLHSLDFSFLTKNRPLWDIIMILLLSGGTVVCITACGLGVKFIRRKWRKRVKRREKRRTKAR